MTATARRLLLLTISLLLPLLLLEVALRTFWNEGLETRMLQAQAGEAYFGARMLENVDPDALRYAGRPGATVTIRDVEYRHNADGLRYLIGNVILSQFLGQQVNRQQASQ